MNLDSRQEADVLASLKGSERVWRVTADYPTATPGGDVVFPRASLVVESMHNRPHPTGLNRATRRSLGVR